MNNKMAVITVIYNNYSILNDFIDSLSKQRDKNYHAFIIDQSSKKQALKLPESCQLIYADNKGYSHGVNTGLQTALGMGFKKFCIINSDTYFEEDFVEMVNLSLIKNKNSLIGGKIYYAYGFEYHKDKYKKEDLGKVFWYAGGIVDWKNAFIKHRGVDEIDEDQFSKIEKTDFITGCLICFDKNVLDRVGFWNEEYFLYYEDADFCERAKRKEINLFYDPSIVIWHKNAQSTSGSGSQIHQKHQKRSRLLFGLKYAPLKTKIHLLMNYFF